MDTSKLLEKLNDLIALDVDAIHAYDQAISACTKDELKKGLTEFRADHDRHVKDLSDCVRQLGGEPQVRRDLKGYFIGGFTAIVSQGDHSALVAMQTNEELTNSYYRRALEMPDLSPDIRALLEKNFTDEQRHLQWIKEQISARTWERRAA
ncbi:MAG TPA: ferritin-like domain-containing protein [Polyangium sp.]|nr:ferritin-like domain-containing protein [Polyangium sp.]